MRGGHGNPLQVLKNDLARCYELVNAVDRFAHYLWTFRTEPS